MNVVTTFRAILSNLPEVALLDETERVAIIDWLASAFGKLSGTLRKLVDYGARLKGSKAVVDRVGAVLGKSCEGEEVNIEEELIGLNLTW